MMIKNLPTARLIYKSICKSSVNEIRLDCSCRASQSGYTKHQITLLALGVVHTLSGFNKPLKKAFETVDARQKQARKRSLRVTNQHF